MKKEELTSEQDAVLRDYLVQMLMPYRQGRAIHGVLGEAQAIFNCVFLLDETDFPEHKDINPCPQLYDALSGVQRIFLHCINRLRLIRTYHGCSFLFD